MEIVYILRGRDITVTGYEGCGGMLRKQIFQRFYPCVSGGIDQVGQMFLPDEVAGENYVCVGYGDDGISTGVSKHVTDLHQTITQIDIDRVGVHHVRLHQRFDLDLASGLGLAPKNFMFSVLSQPRRLRCARMVAPAF